MAEQHREQMATREQSYQRQVEQQREEMAKLITQLAPGQSSSPVTSPPVAMTTSSFAVPHLIQRLNYGRITGPGFKYVWRQIQYQQSVSQTCS